MIFVMSSSSHDWLTGSLKGHTKPLRLLTPLSQKCYPYIHFHRTIFTYVTVVSGIYWQWYWLDNVLRKNNRTDLVALRTLWSISSTNTLLRMRTCKMLENNRWNVKVWSKTEILFNSFPVGILIIPWSRRPLIELKGLNSSDSVIKALLTYRLARWARRPPWPNKTPRTLETKHSK